MAQQLDRAGTFRAEIVDYLLLPPFKSGTVALKITVRITAEWQMPENDEEEGSWLDWSEYGVEAEGNQWLIKSHEKGGGINQNTAENLVHYAGWDGDLDSLQNRTWKPCPCQVVCQEETDPGRAHYNAFPVAFVNAYDVVPGAQKQMTPDVLSQLKAQHGAGLRALAGNVQRNTPAPSGKPPAPPGPENKGLTQEEIVAATEEASKGGDDIPF